MNQYKLDGWKLKIRDEEFTLDKNSEIDQGVKKFLDAQNAGNYRQMLEVWIKYFAVKASKGIFELPMVYQYIPDNRPDYSLMFHAVPSDEEQNELLALYIPNQELDYKIRINLLHVYIPLNKEQSKFYNDQYIQCLETAMVKDFSLGKYLGVKKQFIKTYNQMKNSLDTRMKNPLIGTKEFCRNELSMIYGNIERVDRLDNPIGYTEWIKGNTSEQESYLCPDGWEPEVFKFKKLVETELQKIKAGIQFVPIFFKINWRYNGEGTGFIHYKYFWKIILANAYARIIFDLERKMDEPPDHKRKKSKSKVGFKFLGKKYEYAELFKGLEPYLYKDATLDTFKNVFNGTTLSDITPVKWRNTIVSEPLYLIWKMQELDLIEKRNRQDYEVFKACFVDNSGNEFHQNLRAAYSDINIKIDSRFKENIDKILNEMI